MKMMLNRIAIIGGRGRVGGSLTRALRSAGHTVRVIGRSDGEQDPEYVARWISEAEVVLVCVPDSAIAEVVADYAGCFQQNQVVAHVSGALSLEPLAPAAARRAHIGRMHPLCAVPSPRTYLFDAAAAISGDSTAITRLYRLACDAGMRPFTLPSDETVLYHAAAVLASNGMVALASEASKLLRLCGLDEKEALAALFPLMGSALRGLQHQGLPGALTGPIARGDAEVVRAHLEALTRRGCERALPLYQSLSAAMLPLSKRLREASARSLAEIAAVLKAGEEPRGRAGAPSRRRAPLAARKQIRPRRARASRGRASS
jgi:predicted short-subunit dehydrogenase-like oxidoreductase (DUF2520 family)